MVILHLPQTFNFKPSWRARWTRFYVPVSVLLTMRRPPCRDSLDRRAEDYALPMSASAAPSPSTSTCSAYIHPYHQNRAWRQVTRTMLLRLRYKHNFKSVDIWTSFVYPSSTGPFRIKLTPPYINSSNMHATSMHTYAQEMHTYAYVCIHIVCIHMHLSAAYLKVQKSSSAVAGKQISPPPSYTQPTVAMHNLVRVGSTCSCLNSSKYDSRAPSKKYIYIFLVPLRNSYTSIFSTSLRPFTTAPLFVWDKLLILGNSVGSWLQI